MRATVKIPAAGETVSFPLTGRSVIVEQSGVYRRPAAVPLIGFSGGTNQRPIYPRSSYLADEDFSNITITGTAESAGDEVTLLTLDECVSTKLNIQFLETVASFPGTTFFVKADDTAQQLNPLLLIDPEFNLPKKITVAVARGLEGSIKYAFGADPVQGDDSDGYELTTAPMSILGWAYIEAFTFIAAETGKEPILNITAEY